MMEEYPFAIEYLDGIGIHAYSNFFTPPQQLGLISQRHPDKFLMSTEASEGSFTISFVLKIVESWWTCSNSENNFIDTIQLIRDYSQQLFLSLFIIKMMSCYLLIFKNRMSLKKWLSFFICVKMAKYFEQSV